MARILGFLLLMLAGAGAQAGEVTVAVASNFLTTAEEIAKKFSAETGHKVVLSHGSTGQLYAQIDAGAPFDVYLAADVARPKALEAVGKARDVRIYALGKLVLISTVPVDLETVQTVFAGRTAALADPTVAPYGLASTAALEKLGLDTATFRPVLVANVGQVGTVFATGNADFAFVSAAQLSQLQPPYALDLQGLHPDIAQGAALLTRSEGNPASEAFWEWLFSDEGQALIAAAGYDLPK